MSSSVTIHVGHVIDVLDQLEEHSVHAVITSPPYFGLRKYAGDQVVSWPEGEYRPMPGLDPITVAAMDCAFGAEQTLEAYVAHTVLVFRALRRVVRPGGNVAWNVGDSYARDSRVRWDNTLHREHGWKVDQKTRSAPNLVRDAGLKPKDRCLVPQRIALAVQADGWWVRNDIPWVKRNAMPGSQRDRPTVATEHILLCGHPDSPKGKFSWDQEAVKVKCSGKAAGNKSRPKAEKEAKTKATERHVSTFCGERVSKPYHSRIIRDTDWFYDSLRALLHDDPKQRVQGLLTEPETGEPLALCVNPRPYKGAHFAVFPPTLVEPFIKATTPEVGVCGDCGAPPKRITGRACGECGAFVPTHAKSCPDCGHVRNWMAGRFELDTPEAKAHGATDYSTPGRGTPRKRGSMGDGTTVPLNARDGGLTPEHGMERTGMSHYGYSKWLRDNPKRTNGWESTCDCAADRVPATVLDPFGGAGTVGLVAAALNRRSILVELSDDYATQARRWIEQARPLFNRVKLRAKADDS